MVHHQKDKNRSKQCSCHLTLRAYSIIMIAITTPVRIVNLTMGFSLMNKPALTAISATAMTEDFRCDFCFYARSLPSVGNFQALLQAQSKEDWKW